MIHEFLTSAMPAAITLIGAFFLCRLRLFFIVHPIKTLKMTFSGASPVRELSLSLAGTLGVGNIVGVAMAISLGGAGAVFWMWLSALVSAVLKYAEITLAVKYRRFTPRGVLGGPMYYMEDGVGGRFGRVLAVTFSALGVLLSLVMGNLVQSRAAVGAAERILPYPAWAIGIVLAILCVFSIFGGYRAASRVTSVIVPLMSAAYILISLWIIATHIAAVPAVLKNIVSSAFDTRAAGGGALGFLTSSSLRHGVAKGAFSHEAGGGTAPLSHAQTKEKVPARQGLLGLFEVFFDTGVICTLTALVILLGGNGSGGAARVYDAFTLFCGKFGGAAVSVSIVFFAFSTMICWGYYGKTCLDYLTKSRAAGKIYLVFYCAFIVAGALVGEGAAWMLTDIGVSLMTTVNLAAVVLLSRTVREETELAGLLPRKLK